MESLKQECFEKLGSLPVTVPRLLLAHKHGLKEYYERCLDYFAESFDEVDMSSLQANTEVLSDLTFRAQARFKKLKQGKRKLQEIQSKKR